MVDVFISYSRGDLAMVTRLARAVEAEGYAVWWDAELPPHQSYGDVITAKIEQTKAAIVVWSAGAVKSEWVRAEADMARHHRKLVQTAIDDVMPPLPFNQIQYAKIGDWNGEPDHPGWRKVLLSLADLCGPREGGAAAVAPAPIPAAPPPAPPSPQAAYQAPPAAAPVHHPQPAPAGGASRWPLFAGIGIAVVGLAAAGGVLLGRGDQTPAVQSAPAPSPTAEAASAPAPAPASSPTGAAAVVIAQPPAAHAPPPDPDEEAALQPNPADMEFADSSTRLLQPAEVMDKGPTTLRVARNEIYARKGRRFQDPWLRDWFGRYTWYRPRFDTVPLNAIERQNVELLQRAEQRYK